MSIVIGIVVGIFAAPFVALGLIWLIDKYWLKNVK